ncbi:MAG: relaxase/mobilization nuclease domain-containing protein [Clostridia bacterium]|nr:relaxase/mobilization nuclease domain-containing protein [Clostridia bacterium]
MPLFKMMASKSPPRNGIHYVTRKDKAIRVGNLNMFGKTEDEFVEEFQANVEFFHKEQREDSRTYYHCILSPDPKDGITPDNMLDFAGDVAEEFFPESQCVIGVHRDNGNVHAHIIVNATNIQSGNKLQVNKYLYSVMKEKVNVMGEKYGLTPIDFHKKPDVKISSAERQHISKYGTSRFMAIRDAIEKAMKEAVDENDFIHEVEKKNIQITRAGKDYSFLGPGAAKAVRGGTLGALYTRDYVTGYIENRMNNLYDEDYLRKEAIQDKFEEDFKDGSLHFGAGYDELYEEYKNIVAEYPSQPGYVPGCLTEKGASESARRDRHASEVYIIYLEERLNYSTRLMRDRFELRFQKETPSGEDPLAAKKSEEDIFGNDLPGGAAEAMDGRKNAPSQESGKEESLEDILAYLSAPKENPKPEPEPAHKPKPKYDDYDDKFLSK